MHTYAESLYTLDDLKITLIENKTDIPFITSDDPAIMANRWVDMKAGRFIGRSYGIGSAGLICLLPLSPEVYCILYDSDVYTIPAKDNWISIKSEKDVEALNLMQYLNCFANLYFKEKHDSTIFSNLRSKTHLSRPTTRHNINYAIKTKTNNGYTTFVAVDKNDIPEHTEALIHLEVLRIKPSSWPSFLKWRTGGFYYSNDNGRGHLRKAHSINTGDIPYFKKRTGM